MFLAENLKNTVKREHRIWLVKYCMGQAQTFITSRKREQIGFVAEMFSLFLLGDIFTFVKYVHERWKRYTRFARAIYCRFAPMRYDINPLAPERAYRLTQSNIAPEGNITSPIRDLYRCVFSVKDNTLNSIARCSTALNHTDIIRSSFVKGW